MRALVLLILLLPIVASADGGKSVVRVYPAQNDHFRFEVCSPECKTMGRAEGYTKAELEDWKKFHESSTSDLMPMVGMVGGFAALIGAIVFLPVIVTAGISAALVAGFSYFFFHSPQIEARMPNDVYREFAADPNLLPEFKNFLLELDQGKPVMDREARVLSSRTEMKEELVAPAPKSASKVFDAK